MYRQIKCSINKICAYRLYITDHTNSAIRTPEHNLGIGIIVFQLF